MTIPLGRKNEPLTENKPSEPDMPSMTYPSFTVSRDEPLKLPGKDFEAKVTLHVCRTEVSEDEKGNKRCVYTFDVRDIAPGKCCPGEDEEGEDEEPADAASAIMKSMKMAREKKISDTEED